MTIGSFSQVCGGAPGGSGPLAPAAPASSGCVHDPGNDLANRLCHFFESVGKFFEVFCFSGGASVLAAAAIGLLTALFPGRRSVWTRSCGRRCLRLVTWLKLTSSTLHSVPLVRFVGHGTQQSVSEKKNLLNR